MSKSHWLLVTDLAKPGSVTAMHMDAEKLKSYGISGRLGDEYFLSTEDTAKHRVVGRIGDQAAEFLDAANALAESMETGTSEGLRYDIFEQIVDDVVSAIQRAAELSRTKA